MLLSLSLAISLCSIIAIFANQILSPIIVPLGEVRVQDVLRSLSIALLRIQRST